MKQLTFISMEITIISAQGLKSTSNLFSCHRRIRPFITLTTTDGGKRHHVYNTKVDKHGGANPIWGDKFRLAIGSTCGYVDRNSSCIYLELYTKRLIRSDAQLGWCQVPVADIINEFFPAEGIRRLSYQLRDKYGSRGHGVVNIEVKLDGLYHVSLGRFESPSTSRINSPENGVPETVVGIPVTVLGHGVVNIEVKLDGLYHVSLGRFESPSTSRINSPENGVPETVVGIPVTVARDKNRQYI